MTPSLKLPTLAVILLTAGTASAAMMYTGTDKSGRSASADFSVSDGILSITLTNTATYDLMSNDQVLTALFFGTKEDYAFKPLSATLPKGSVVIRASQPAEGNVGGEWAYSASANVAGAQYGIGAAGFGIFGPKDVFSSLDLTGQANVGGMDYGITTASDNAKTGNGTAGKNPLISNSVLFQFAINDAFDLASINSVAFQYGTALDEPRFSGSTPPTPPSSDPPIIVVTSGGGGSIPEPSITGMGGILASLALLKRRRRAA